MVINMCEYNNVPKIRFKGFTDVWEQRELWELTIWDKKFNEVEAEKQPKIVKYPYVLADVFSKIEDASGDVRLLSTGNYIGYTTDEKAGKNLCVGEVVAIPWGGVPNIKYYKGKFVTADNRIATSNDTETLGNRFLSLYLEHSLAFLQSIYRGASIKHPSMNDVLSMQISIPHIQEQREIETWFANLDNLITLHQRKCDTLVNVKKSLLEKMFPKNSSNIPEIRFKEFTDVWEQRKLGEIGNTFTGLSGKTKEDFGHGEAKFVTYMNVFSNPIAQFNKTEPIEIDNKQNQVEYGDVFFTTSSETPDEVGMSSVWLENKGNIYLNSFCFGFRPFVKNDPYYMAYMLRSKNFRKNMTLLAQGISRYNISKNGVMNIDIQLPINQEQEKIGKLFYEIDNLITLHQRKLEKLKNIKKSMLEKMFV